MSYSFQWDHPVVSHCVLNVSVVARYHRVQFTLWKVQKGTKHDLDTRADICLFRFLKFVVISSARLWGLNHIINHFPKKFWHLSFELSFAVCHTIKFFR